jgi:hypothetical protein
MNRKLLFSTAAAGLMAAGLAAGPASADVTVTATIDKTKTVDVLEYIFKFKYVYIDVVAGFTLEGAAEAEAITNIINAYNSVDGQDVDLTDLRTDYLLQGHARIGDSVSGGSGVAGINQSTGNMANQGNIVSVAAIANEPGAFVDAQAETDQKNFNNTVVDRGGVTLPPNPRPDPSDPNAVAAFDPRRTAYILNSINANAGIVDLNQDAGNMNNQTNADAIAIAFGGTLALSEAALGQVNTGNTINEVETVKIGRIEDSINNNTGIVKVNQATGNMNNQANNVAFAALTTTAAIGTPFGLSP